MSAKTTSGPSKSPPSAPRKRGRPAASRTAAKSSPVETENPDGITAPEPAPPTAVEKKTRTRRAATPKDVSKAEAIAASTPTRRRRKTDTETVELTEKPKKTSARAKKDAASEIQAPEAPKSRSRKPKVKPDTAETKVTEPKKRGRKPKTDLSVAEPAPEPVAETPVIETEISPAPKPRRTRRPKATPPAIVDSSPAETAPATPAPQPEPQIEVPVETPSPVAENQPLFTDLGLGEPIMRAIQELGYQHPTPIQAQAIPEVLKGHDVLGVAQTGTGKTASFTLPMLEKLSGSRARARMPRSLILEPTRELALQVADNFKLYGKHLRLTHALLIGGSNMAEQREILNRGVDVLIATPGRLLDLFERGGLLLTQTSTLVIDEADRMLDMGFIPDIEKIVALLPPSRQTLFFSATMAPDIRRLADAFLRQPVEITVSRPSSVASTITEGLIVTEERNKRHALRKLLKSQDVQSAIVFCNRKRDVDILQRYLTEQGFATGHLHGDLAQSLRFSTLERFKSGELKILVCSDVAARGIDIGGLSHVFNFDLPFNAEDYVHRIGRTGRAGNQGHAYSIAGTRDYRLLEAIETLTGKVIPRMDFEGIENLDWASDDEKSNSRPTQSRARTDETPSHDEDDDSGRRKRRRGGRNRHRSNRDENLPSPAIVAEENPSLQNESIELLPAFENDGPKTGFGGDTPAFMLVPRRRRITVPKETDLTLPVQHDARHYGDE